MRAESAREQREWELEQMEQRDQAQMRAELAERQERAFIYEHGVSSAEWHRAMAEAAAAREARNPLAEYGSTQRSAVLIDGVMMQPREAVRPLRRESELDRALSRARQRDEFMEREIRRYHARRDAARRREQEAEIQRLEADLGYREITRGTSMYH